MKNIEIKGMYNKEVYQRLKYAVDQFKNDGVKEHKLYPITTEGRGRYSKYRNKWTEYVNALESFNIDYTTGNDAVGGGAYGNYLLIKVDMRKAIFKQALQEVEQEGIAVIQQRTLSDYSSDEYQSKALAIMCQVSIQDIETLINDFKESKDILIARKEQGLSFKQTRFAISEVLKLGTYKKVDN